MGHPVAGCSQARGSGRSAIEGLDVAMRQFADGGSETSPMTVMPITPEQFRGVAGLPPRANARAGLWSSRKVHHRVGPTVKIGSAWQPSTSRSNSQPWKSVSRALNSRSYGLVEAASRLTTVSGSRHSR